MNLTKGETSHAFLHFCMLPERKGIETYWFASTLTRLSLRTCSRVQPGSVSIHFREEPESFPICKPYPLGGQILWKHVRRWRWLAFESIYWWWIDNQLWQDHSPYFFSSTWSGSRVQNAGDQYSTLSVLRATADVQQASVVSLFRASKFSWKKRFWNQSLLFMDARTETNQWDPPRLVQVLRRGRNKYDDNTRWWILLVGLGRSSLLPRSWNVCVQGSWRLGLWLGNQSTVRNWARSW